MIKKVLKYSLLAYLAIPALGILYLAIRHGFHPNLPDFLEGLLLVLLVEGGFFFVGLILGLIITAIARRPHLEWRFYLIGQAAALLTLSVYITNGILGDSSRKPEIGNYDLTTPGHTDEASRPFIRPAFGDLQKRFKPADSLHLRMFDAYENDTLNPARRDTTFTVGLVYTLAGAKGRLFYSKYLMGRGKAQLLVFNKVIESPAAGNIR